MMLVLDVYSNSFTGDEYIFNQLMEGTYNNKCKGIEIYKEGLNKSDKLNGITKSNKSKVLIRAENKEEIKKYLLQLPKNGLGRFSINNIIKEHFN